VPVLGHPLQAVEAAAHTIHVTGLDVVDQASGGVPQFARLSRCEVPGLTGGKFEQVLELARTSGWLRLHYVPVIIPVT